MVSNVSRVDHFSRRLAPLSMSGEVNMNHHRNDRSSGKTRKEIKRNRKPKRPRQKHWSLEDWEDGSCPDSERIVAPGGQSRGRHRLTRGPDQFLSWGDKHDCSAQGRSEVGEIGVITQVSTGLCRVRAGRHNLICALRGNLSASTTGLTNVVAVGDRVEVVEDKRGRGVVTGVLPRTSAFARVAVGRRHLEQVLVANAEQVLIVHSWREPRLWPELIDRCLIASLRNGLRPVICLNKTDLADGPADYRTALRPYEHLGYLVLYTSAVTGLGLDRLQSVLVGSQTVLAGLSGVGKTSLIQLVQPCSHLAVGEVSERRHEGRHTTTQVTLLLLSGGGWIADTPGVREFGLIGLTRAQLGQYYPEFDALAKRCRFGDCLHLTEPECAVRAALRSGGVSRLRYRTYKKLCQEIPG
jgi:ribosome biogenesis GTPase